MWFMTYSDVITLLMTFFILLLTFATNEPEAFKQVQSSMFGGSRGIAGSTSEAVDREAIVVRYRPDVSRIATSGSSMPPMYTDSVRESVDKGLKSLDEQNDLAFDQRFALEVAPSLFMAGDGQLTPLARQHLDMLGLQMQRLPLFVHFVVTDREDLPSAVLAIETLVKESGINPGRMSVELAAGAADRSRKVRIVVSRREGATDVVGEAPAQQDADGEADPAPPENL
jgi:hypothetical protein